MTADDHTTPHYRLSISGWVNDAVVKLAADAKARGDGEAFLAALSEFFRRLRIYPQFGDPLSDLHAYEGQMRLGIIPPLAMRYAVLEDQRLVLVAAPPVLLAKSRG